MKTVLIIGMGRFGHHLASNMISLGNEVMIVDKDESRLEDLTKLISNIKIGDCTNEEVLRSLGVGNFDLCFVCIGSNFQSSLEITSLVKELGAKHVVSKANRDIHAKFLLRNGADDGSRTHLIGLGSRSSTDELHPRMLSFFIITRPAGNFNKNFAACFGKIISRSELSLSRPGKWRVTAARGGSPPAALTPRRDISRYR